MKVVLLKEEELREILLEVEILRDCGFHPNIVRFMGTFLRSDDLWICMEYCEGGAVDTLYQSINYYYIYVLCLNIMILVFLFL